LDALKQHTDRERELVRAKLRKAQEQIERDLQENEGIYPFNKGRLTQAELCRRASIGMATLQGPAHKDAARKEVNAWLDGVKKRALQGHRKVRRAVTDRTDVLKQAYQELQSGWAVAELVYIEAQHRIAKLEEELVALHEELAVLRAVQGHVSSDAT